MACSGSPTAAAVAAAHWLDAAATIAAEESGLEPVQVVLEADNIEALPHETPTRVLEHRAPHIDQADLGQREQRLDALRLTTLDPTRPALDLLEDL